MVVPTVLIAFGEANGILTPSLIPDLPRWLKAFPRDHQVRVPYLLGSVHERLQARILGQTQNSAPRRLERARRSVSYRELTRCHAVMAADDDGASTMHGLRAYRVSAGSRWPAAREWLAWSLIWVAAVV